MARPAPRICRHCNRYRVNRPRGLCWTCYYTPGVLAAYPVVSKYARRGVGNVTGNRPLPTRPTAAEPGTPEKIAVLAGRAARAEGLWHPDDARATVPQPTGGDR